MTGRAKARMNLERNETTDESPIRVLAFGREGRHVYSLPEPQLAEL
jgi:hypothetical protein